MVAIVVVKIELGRRPICRESDGQKAHKNQLNEGEQIQLFDNEKCVRNLKRAFSQNFCFLSLKVQNMVFGYYKSGKKYMSWLFRKRGNHVHQLFEMKKGRAFLRAVNVYAR